jgi:hypothetical protein
MVGTPKKRVGRKSRNSAAAFWCSKRGSRRIRQPDISQQWMPLPSPCTWNSGSASRKRSAEVICQHASRLTAFAAKLLWVRTAPFDAPVVPDV